MKGRRFHASQAFPTPKRAFPVEPSFLLTTFAPLHLSMHDDFLGHARISQILIDGHQRQVVHA